MLQMIYFLEVSYKTPNGIFKRDKKIIRTSRADNEYETYSSGWRNLIFTFDNRNERNDCFERCSKLKDVCISHYEKKISMLE